MAGEAKKTSLLVVIPPPIWAFLFVLAAWGATAALDLGQPWRLSAVGVALLITGFAIAASGRLTFARKGAEIHPASTVNSVLVTTGPFRFSRNPMYLGILTLLIGVAFLVGAIPFFAAAVVFFLWVNFISIPFEEEKMERQFGDD
ncbi:MAG: methyltransferase family protein [Parvularculaceae bacterium]